MPPIQVVPTPKFDINMKVTDSRGGECVPTVFVFSQTFFDFCAVGLHPFGDGPSENIVRVKFLLRSGARLRRYCRAGSVLTRPHLASVFCRRLIAAKVCFVGDAGCGKTSILQRWANDTFSEDTKSTIGPWRQCSAVEPKSFYLFFPIFHLVGLDSAACFASLSWI